ncbi:MAG: septal ring lytic transglycosylase RlpA family protein [Candidatus Aminicenantes bacterium]
MNKRILKYYAFFMILVLVCLSSCRQKSYRTYPNVMTGKASWYGPKFHGRTTSSKEVFDMYDMTAAHKTIPFGTYVMVTNLNNGKSVKVRINDRGPFKRGRIIDLSYAAARVLDMVGPGVVPVRIEVLSHVCKDLDEQKYALQVGAFLVKENALVLKSELDKKYQNVYISEFKTPHRIYYRVRLHFNSRREAVSTAKDLQKQGREVFIVEYHD